MTEIMGGERFFPQLRGAAERPQRTSLPGRAHTERATGTKQWLLSRRRSMPPVMVMPKARNSATLGS